MFVYSNLLSNEIINYHHFKKYSIIISFMIVCSILNPVSVQAEGYPIPQDGARLIGIQQEYKVQPGDTLNAITKLYNVGLIALMESNPGVDPFLPTPGKILQIPNRMLLPDVPHKGIVINLPELRLYYFPKGKEEVHVFPIGIGRIGRSTPTMQTTVRMKIKHPSWTPTTKSRVEHFQATGKHLPSVVKAGKDNPLGDYALQLAYGNHEYLIHGTNKDFGIGMRVSAGCIRLNPDDISWLFEQVENNESVQIINEPIKVSLEPNGQKILEVHSPISRSDDDTQFSLYWTKEVIKFNNKEVVDNDQMTEALLLHQGIPVVIESE
ncbi:MAG: lipoprotein-anchoring transpeptidase ErfK/SrfK [Psychromonas sp.]|jgi:lipoprotein-anchoring transpeptidase ErfK/SrfK